MFVLITLQNTPRIGRVQLFLHRKQDFIIFLARGEPVGYSSFVNMPTLVRPTNDKDAPRVAAVFRNGRSGASISRTVYYLAPERAAEIFDAAVLAEAERMASK